MGIGANLASLSHDAATADSDETGIQRFLNVCLFFPVISLNSGIWNIFDLALITDVSLIGLGGPQNLPPSFDPVWSSRLSLKMNVLYGSISVGFGYFSEFERFLPYVGVGIVNGLLF